MEREVNRGKLIGEQIGHSEFGGPFNSFDCRQKITRHLVDWGKNLLLIFYSIEFHVLQGYNH